MPTAENIHANLIAIKRKGVLICGPSGIGKTALALHLFRRCRQANIDVDWIADDQVLLRTSEGQLLGHAPETTVGKIEIRGMGIVEAPMPKQDEVRIMLKIDLTSRLEMIRMWDGQRTSICEVQIDTLTLGADNIEAAGNAVLAMLGHPIWI